MSDAENRAREQFDAGYCCAEAVLMALAEEHGVRSKLIPRIATGLCGGMSRTGGACGALTGAVLALSLLFGRDQPSDDRDLNNQLIQRLTFSFQSRWGATDCTSVCGHDLTTDAGRQNARNDPQHHDHCREVVGTATRIADELAEIGLQRR